MQTLIADGCHVSYLFCQEKSSKPSGVPGMPDTMSRTFVLLFTVRGVVLYVGTVCALASETVTSAVLTLHKPSRTMLGDCIISCYILAAKLLREFLEEA